MRLWSKVLFSLQGRGIFGQYSNEIIRSVYFHQVSSEFKEEEEEEEVIEEMTAKKKKEEQLFEEQDRGRMVVDTR